MERQITAVDFIAEKLEKFIPSGNQIAIGIIIEQANKIFETQIMDACNEFGNLNGVDIEDYQAYYHETFKKEKTS